MTGNTIQKEGVSAKDSESWSTRRWYLVIIMLYAMGMVLYSVYKDIDTPAAQAAVEMGIASVVLNVFIYVLGAVISDNYQKKAQRDTEETMSFIKHTKWLYRKITLYISTAFLMTVGIIPIFTETMSHIGSSATSLSIIALSIINAGYVYGAVLDDKLQMFDRILNKSSSG